METFALIRPVRLEWRQVANQWFADDGQTKWRITRSGAGVFCRLTRNGRSNDLPCAGYFASIGAAKRYAEQHAPEPFNGLYR